MFEIDAETLKTMGAEITTREIRQQPELWEDTLKIYDDNAEAIAAFLQRAEALGGAERTHVVFTGAGTSAYVGDTCTPYLRRHGDNAKFRFSAIATTDIVCAPTCVPRIPPCWSPLPAVATAPSPLRRSSARGRS